MIVRDVGFNRETETFSAEDFTKRMNNLAMRFRFWYFSGASRLATIEYGEASITLHRLST